MIRQAINQINEKIARLQDERTVIQENCKHKNIHEVDYSWRVGVYEKGIVCKDCDKLI